MYDIMWSEDEEPLPPAEEPTMSDPAVSALLTRELCLRGGRLTLAEIPQYVDLSAEHIGSIVREEAKRFPQPEPGIVLAQSPVRLCAAYLREQCQAPDCPRLHLCRFFVLERCFHRRGRRDGKVCKFSHDISSEINGAVLKANGISDFKEKELRVLLLLNDPSCLPEVCREYKGERNEVSCPKGEQCSRLHVCQHFVRGQCRYFKCNRSHNLLATKASQIMKQRGLSEEMMQSVQLLRVHMCNEARKEPWKEEKTRYDKGRNNDHPHFKADSKATKKDDQPKLPQADGSERQEAVYHSHFTSYRNDTNYTIETASEIHSAKNPSIPKLIIPIPLPRKTKTTSPTAAPCPEFQQTDKSNVQAYATPPTPPAKPLIAEPPRTTIWQMYKQDAEKSLHPHKDTTETTKTDFWAADQPQIMELPQRAARQRYLFKKRYPVDAVPISTKGIRQADTSDEQSSTNLRPSTTTTSVRTQSINQLNDQLSSPSSVATTCPAQIGKIAIQPGSNPDVPTPAAVSPPRPANTNSLQTPTRTISVDICKPNVSTTLRPPTPIPKTSTVNPVDTVPIATKEIWQADKSDEQSSTNLRPSATTTSVRTQSINQLNDRLSSTSSLTTTCPAQIGHIAIQPRSNPDVPTPAAVSPPGPAYTNSLQTPTRTISVDISKPNVSTTVRPPTPIPKISTVNPPIVTDTGTSANNNPYVPPSLGGPPIPSSSNTATMPSMQNHPTEVRRVVSQVNANTAYIWDGSQYSSRGSTHNGIYEFDPYGGLAPPAPTRNAPSKLHVRQVVTTPEDRGDPNEICFYHLWKFCKHQNKCGQMHYHLPYRWQIRKASKTWEDLPWMEDIEKAYSDPDNTSSGKYDINFEKMTCLHHRVRRLSTASSVTQPPDHLMTTEWVWHWKNELGKWIEYGKHGGKEKATIASADLETIYLADKSSVVPFQAGAQRYEINFKDLVQKNLFYKTEKEVRRRPRFVTKEDVDKLKAGIRTVPVASPPSPTVQGIPAYWDSTALPDPGYKLVDINKHSTEYKEIEKSFGLTMSGHSIQKLQRIQNITLWKFYQMQKEVMKKQNKKDVLEMKLFHGTNVTHVPAICHSNFDWRICGLNGTVYGRGSYFARDASYSHNYCQSSSNSKTMFLVRVLVGDFVTGHSSYLRPPLKYASQTNYYDSCVDKPHDPSIYVVFEKNQIYPEYMMEYTENKKCCIS